MIERVARFGMVGLGATAAYYAVSLTATLMMNVFWANLMGFAVAVFVSYFGHERFTFSADRTMADHRQATARFAVSTLAAFATSQATLFATVKIFQLPDWLGLATVVLVVPIFSFFLFRFWVFVPRARSKTAAITGEKLS